MITYRPIDVWPRELTEARKPNPFFTDLPDSKKLLRYEVGRLDGERIVVQVALVEDDFRVDGTPKLRAEYYHPGVIVNFESKHGPLRYMTDEFDSWPANLHAVARGLEALRKLERYGISSRGEQYTGWRQLESGGMGREAAIELLREWGGLIPLHAEDPERIKSAYRRSAQVTHPDTGGSEHMFNAVQTARDRLLALLS